MLASSRSTWRCTVMSSDVVGSSAMINDVASVEPSLTRMNSVPGAAFCAKLLRFSAHNHRLRCRSLSLRQHHPLLTLRLHLPRIAAVDVTDAPANNHVLALLTRPLRLRGAP